MLKLHTLNYHTIKHPTYFCIIVIFHLFYKDPQRHIIKRIIGLEDDIIRNDKYSFREVAIPKGYCWVEGDNTAASSDSIKYGPSKIKPIFTIKP